MGDKDYAKIFSTISFYLFNSINLVHQNYYVNVSLVILLGLKKFVLLSKLKNSVYSKVVILLLKKFFCLNNNNNNNNNNNSDDNNNNNKNSNSRSNNNDN